MSGTNRLHIINRKCIIGNFYYVMDLYKIIPFRKSAYCLKCTVGIIILETMQLRPRTNLDIVSLVENLSSEKSVNDYA